MANQRMLHPALLTFMWEAVKGKRGKKKKKKEGGTEDGEQTGGKALVMKAKLGHPQLQKNNFRLSECSLIKDRATTQCEAGTKHLALK